MTAEGVVASMVATLFLLLSIALVARSWKPRKGAVLRFRVREWFRMAMVVAAVLMAWLIHDSQWSVALYAFPLSWVVMTYGIDIYIERSGFFFAGRFVPWADVVDIRSTRAAFVVVGPSTAKTKIFLKALWRIDSSDGEQAVRVFHTAKGAA